MNTNTSLEKSQTTVTLRSSDGEEFVISSALSTTLKKTVEGKIPLDSETLATVIAYLNANNEEKSNFDVAEKEIGLLKKLFMAAHNLEIRGLLDIVAARIAAIIEKKPLSWLRREFGSEDSRLTPEEEAAIRLQDAWAWDERGELEDD